jgi:hypothetical protein
MVAALSVLPASQSLANSASFYGVVLAARRLPPMGEGVVGNRCGGWGSVEAGFGAGGRRFLAQRFTAAAWLY